MKDKLFSQLAELNQADKRLEMLYHEYAKEMGMSDCVNMMLYHLYTGEETYTQKDLCNVWSYSRQTVNSALKNMEKQGIVQMELTKGNKKNKYVRLTKEGQEIAKRTVQPLLSAEIHALASLKEEERTMMLCLYKKYIDALENGITDRYGE